MMGIGEKNRKYKNLNKKKIPRLVNLPPTPVYKMEADCFPVPENTANKPDLP